MRDAISHSEFFSAHYSSVYPKTPAMACEGEGKGNAISLGVSIERLYSRSLARYLYSRASTGLKLEFTRHGAVSDTETYLVV